MRLRIFIWAALSCLLAISAALFLRAGYCKPHDMSFQEARAYAVKELAKRHLDGHPFGMALVHGPANRMQYLLVFRPSILLPGQDPGKYPQKVLHFKIGMSGGFTATYAIRETAWIPARGSIADRLDFLHATTFREKMYGGLATEPLSSLPR